MKVCARPGCGNEFAGSPHKIYCGADCRYAHWALMRQTGQRPSRKPDRHIVHVSGVVHERLEVEADARGVSMSWLANKLLTESLELLIPAAELKLTRD